MFDASKILVCPACGKEMKKVFIDSVGFNVDICTDGCGGILFDNREIKHFEKQNDNIDEILKVKEGKTFEKQDESKVRVCPVCGVKMVKHYANALKEVEIDECYNCGAIFLDDGELEKIRSQYVNEDSKDLDSKFFDMMESQFKSEVARNRWWSPLNFIQRQYDHNQQKYNNERERLKILAQRLKNKLD